jgi:uncharacterized protein (DUF433 family)
MTQEDIEIDMFDTNRITFEPQIMGGQACIRGMRIPVSLIINLIAHQKPRPEILSEYPDLEDEDISAALLYAAWLSQDRLVTFDRVS